MSEHDDANYVFYVRIERSPMDDMGDITFRQTSREVLGGNADLCALTSSEQRQVLDQMLHGCMAARGGISIVAGPFPVADDKLHPVVKDAEKNQRRQNAREVVKNVKVMALTMTDFLRNFRGMFGTELPINENRTKALDVLMALEIEDLLGPPLVEALAEIDQLKEKVQKLEDALGSVAYDLKSKADEIESELPKEARGRRW